MSRHSLRRRRMKTLLFTPLVKFSAFIGPRKNRTVNNLFHRVISAENNIFVEQTDLPETYPAQQRELILQ